MSSAFRVILNLNRMSQFKLEIVISLDSVFKTSLTKAWERNLIRAIPNLFRNQIEQIFKSDWLQIG